MIILLELQTVIDNLERRKYYGMFCKKKVLFCLSTYYKINTVKTKRGSMHIEN